MNLFMMLLSKISCFVFVKLTDQICTNTYLSYLSMVKTVYSVSHGAIRIQRGLLPVVEMGSGKSWPSLLHFVVKTDDYLTSFISF